MSGPSPENRPDLAMVWQTANAAGQEVRAQAELIEGRFAQAGESLFTVIEALRTLIRSCEDLTVELESPDLHEATAALQAVAAEVAAAGRDGARPSEVLPRLVAVANSISGSLDSALAALRPAGIIAMTARVEAARLGQDGMQFSGFAEEIAGAFQTARISLQSLGGQIAGLGARLATALRREAELASGLEAAMREVPRRIATSIEALGAASGSAGAAATAMLRQSQAVSAGASSAVLSLQVGDSARQRFEHIVSALELAAAVGLRGEVSQLGATFSAPDVAAAESLLGLCCRLQAAQLADTAGELSDDMARTIEALGALRGAADGIAAAGADVLQADREGRSFLAELASGVGQAQQLFARLDAAGGEVDDLARSISEASAELATHVKTVAAAEKEVQRLALNAMVKSGRVGDRGRALTVIAQQLKGCVDMTTEQTSAVVERLREVAALADELAAEGDRRARRSVGRATGSMTEAVERLTQMNGRVSAGLAGLRADSAAIAALVQSTAAGFERQSVSLPLLQEAARRLESLALDLDRTGGDAGDCGRAAMARMFDAYTMAREREIHSRVAGDPEPDAGDFSPALAAAELFDTHSVPA